MKLSVVIPTFNEIKRLPATYESIVKYLTTKEIDSEIIFSDGGSNDGTNQYITSLMEKSSPIPIKAVFDKTREGKGAGVKKGMLLSCGDWVLFMDADNSTKIDELDKLLIYRDEYQVIIGSRYAGIEAQVKQNIIRRFVSRSGSLFIRTLLGINIQDTQCGFKLFEKKAAREIFSKLQTKGWGFDVEALLLAKKLSYKIKEVPVKWRDSEGSHLRAGRDSIKTLIEVIHILRTVNKNEKT